MKTLWGKRIFLFSIGIIFVWTATALAAGKRLRYPSVLTNNQWQSNKGSIAKIGGRTGIGAQMDKTQAAYGDINWNKLNVTSVLQGRDMNTANLESFKREVLGDLRSEIRKTKAEAKKLENMATSLAAKWKKSITIPKKSRKYAKRVAKAAGGFASGLEGKIWASWIDPNVRAAEANIERLKASARKAILIGIKAAKKGIKEVQRNPTKDTYNEKVHQRVRTTCAAVGRLPELEKHLRDCKRVSGSNFVVGVSNIDEEMMLEKMKDLKGVLKKIEGSL